MDFDDLEDLEAAQGPGVDERLATLLDAAKAAQSKSVPLPEGKCFAAGGKLKILFFYGACSNRKLATAQVTNFFKESFPDGSWKDNVEVEYFDGTTKVGVEWLGSPAFEDVLKPFGPDFYLYYDHEKADKVADVGLLGPHTQTEDAMGLEDCMDKLAAFLKEKGPYDGWCGFDMGGHVMFTAAKRAQDGDPAFAGMVRFMIFITAMAPRALGPQAGNIPTAALKIPSCCILSKQDENQPFVQFEEASLYFDPASREMILHNEGHKPPRFDKDSAGAKRLQAFMHKMFYSTDLSTHTASSDASDNKEYGDFWLPLLHGPSHPLPTGGNRRLIVVPDLSAGEDVKKHIAEDEKEKRFDILAVKARTSFYLDVANLTVQDFADAVGGRDLVVEAVEYTSAQKKLSLFANKSQIPSIMRIDYNDMVSEEATKIAKKIAEGFMETCAVAPDEQVGIVGIGSGAFIALMIAREFVTSRKVVPAGLWVISPPTAMPQDALHGCPGALVDCPVRYLCHEKSRVGPPWRWEVQTLGPFSQTLFANRKDPVTMVVDELIAAV
eukprot:gnl/TRDRNA2_/TRDRNA2_125786_c0_seq1.p1 gnl/TRDRNA2_/TRDRNA2_125786_c0~~gnl/TRDRNA2_/TRDRNA2_125786_c0_seq1.p1  ORF type:complete len:552 (-),score=118.33 gnl/TRDRNA2_/TRDRNA2_125786_c0_seq1:134-1789(-)